MKTIISDWKLSGEERLSLTKEVDRHPKEVVKSALGKLTKIQNYLSDKDYCEAVNLLIPTAVLNTKRHLDRHKMANKDLVFHQEMKRLKIEAGLIRQ